MAYKKSLNHFYGLNRGETINGSKVSIATVRPAHGAKMLSGIQSGRERNARSDGKLSFTNFEILITNPSYSINGGILPLQHFMNYLFPTSDSVRSDFDWVWNSGIGTKVDRGEVLTKKEIDKLKRIASCGTQFLSTEERYKLIKSVLLYNDSEYYEDLVLDVIATTDTRAKAKDLYDRINRDIDFQELLVENLDDITTWGFFDDGNENNLSRFTREYFKLFKQIHTNGELESLYNSSRFPERNKFFFYGFDYGCDYTLSGSKDKNRVTIKEQAKATEWGKFTEHCINKGEPTQTSFDVDEILAISVADKNVSLFGEKDKVVMMPALAYYLLIKAANDEELESVINGLISIVGIITPYDEFYFLSQAIKLSSRGIRAANLITFKTLTKADNISVPLSNLGKKLKKDAPANIDNYVKFVEGINNAGGNVLNAADIAKLRANSAAHTIERHGFEVTDDLLKRRATEGIAPDGSSIAKKQGGQRIGNVIPPMSSKFKDATSMKKALNAVDESTEAFQNALRIEQANTSGQIQRFKFQVDLGETIGFGYKRPAGTPNYVLTGQKLSGDPIKIDGLTKIEVRYQFNQSTNKFEINTMFPIE